MGTKARGERKAPHKKTSTFLLELPLVVEAGQAARLRAHLETGRQFYNAVLSAGQRRLRQMRADPGWQVARALPKTHTQERRAAFSALRERYGFSEYAFHELARELRVSWLAEHLDAVLAQTLTTRAYRALNRVCVGKARRVRFKSRGRGLGGLKNKRNDTGMRFVLETPEEGQSGYLIWRDDRLPAFIEWQDPVVSHALAQSIKYARLVRRPASSPHAQGATPKGIVTPCNWCSPACPTTSPRTWQASDTVGLDLGPSASPSCRGKRRLGSRSCARSCVPMREPSVACNGVWSGKGAPPIRSTTTSEVGPPSAAQTPKAGSKAMATRSAEGAKRLKSASWRPTARACMGEWPTRSRRWATPSSPRRSPIRAGRNATARPGTSRPRCGSHTSNAPLQARRRPARGSHTLDETVPILSWMRNVRHQAALPALAPVPVRHRAGAA